jgi:DNA polymerase III delta prime subunit
MVSFPKARQFIPYLEGEVKRGEGEWFNFLRDLGVEGRIVMFSRVLSPKPREPSPPKSNMKLFLRITTVLLFIAGIIWLILDPGFDALTAFLTGILTLIGSYVINQKPETETLDQRNRRILLNHVENFWVKGVLEKSLHGAAMLELGIKEDPTAVTYPWALKKETTGETLPAGDSMLEIFEQIGIGRSLLILGAPGSGKTTMLLELARQLIERARQDETEPIPMVFNLASWTEKLPLADWLAQELNNIYYVPRKTAPDWVKGNKLLLLLDGLDEVRQESRAKCVEAINQFRKEHGLTSLAVCSRSQDYEELQTKLAFEGAIEVQPLTQKQVNEFFNRFGKEMAGLKSVLKKDSALREMAETPLFLSIMVMAYGNTQGVNILTAQDIDTQRKHLFDNYIERMFERSRAQNATFEKEDIQQRLSWMARKMIEHNQIPCLFEMQPAWLDKKNLMQYKFMCGLVGRFLGGVFGGIGGYLLFSVLLLTDKSTLIATAWMVGFGLAFALLSGFGSWLATWDTPEIAYIDSITWNLNEANRGLQSISQFISIAFTVSAIIFGALLGFSGIRIVFLAFGLIAYLFWLFFGLTSTSWLK